MNDTSDNFSGTAHLTNPEEHKQNIFEILNLNIQRANDLKASKSSTPDRYILNQNYPNPFNPVTTITFEIPKDDFVQLKVYDITGKEVIELINEFMTAGLYNSLFNGMNLSSGVYFYKLTSGKFELTKLMVLVK